MNWNEKDKHYSYKNADLGNIKELRHPVCVQCRNKILAERIIAYKERDSQIINRRYIMLINIALGSVMFIERINYSIDIISFAIALFLLIKCGFLFFSEQFRKYYQKYRNYLKNKKKCREFYIDRIK